MKRIICLLLTLFLLFPCIATAQSIFVDYVAISDIDQTAFWVITDPNDVKYRGGCTLAIGVDADAYCEAHMAEWLADIYVMNADPNTPDWVDSHMGRYLQGLDMINDVDSFAKVRAVMRKMLKAVYPVVGLPD